MSTTFGTLIDDILTRLNDDGTLFSRAEILRWLNEGYRRLTNQTRHAKTFTAFDMPPRHSSAITFDWEGHVSKVINGTTRKWTFTHSNGNTECTFLWEAQQADDVPVSTQLRAVSHLWEISSGEGEVDAHYRFTLPKNESVIHAVWHDYKLLGGASAKQIDSFEEKWWTISGEPYLWASDLGDAETFEVFEIDTTYRQAYIDVDSSLGTPRAFSGDRTYTVASDNREWSYAYAWTGEPEAGDTARAPGVGRRFTFHDSGSGNFYTHTWEGQQHRGEEITASTAVAETNPFRYDPASTTATESITAQLEVGIMRKAISPDRQYFASGQWAVFGIPRIFRSATDGILVYHSVNADDDLNEAAELVLIPNQVAKYVAYYAMAVLLARQGEGYDTALASHYLLRASRAKPLMERLGNVTRLAESYVRGQPRASRHSRASLPHLPSTFARRG